MKMFKKAVVLILSVISILLCMFLPVNAATSTTQTPPSGSCVRIRYAYNGKYLDVPYEGINEDGTQLQVWDLVPENMNQVFCLKDTGNGWQIVSYLSGKVIEVRDSSHEDFASVNQWESHSLDCARWDIVKNSDGTVSFRNRESKKYLNVSGGGDAANGTKIIQYYNDETAAMKFYIEITEPDDSHDDAGSVDNATVPEGIYTIISALDNAKTIDISNASVDNMANAQLWETNGTSAQDFFLKSHSGGYYTIINEKSGKALDVANGIAASGTNVWQFECNNTPAQRWYLEDAGNGYFYIRSALGYYLDVCCGDTANGSNLQIWDKNSTNAQKFKFVPKSDGDSTNADAGWQMPMENAYCTWRSFSNMSWASYTANSSGRNYHLGIDIYGTEGMVYAAASGKVVATSSSNSGANGRYVILQHTISGKTVYSFYAHLSSVNVSVSQNVAKGTQIGVAGGSGYGSDNKYGRHLHFAVVDTLWSGGGYYGYATKFTGDKVTYKNVSYYNPVYIINNGRLP